MERYDALIVGGGPAGSTCGWKLRQAGLNVLVLDKSQFPRDKTCAGWITPAVVDELQIDANDYQQGRTWQPISGFRTGVIGGEPVYTGYDDVVSYGIRRCEFDHYLLERSGVPCRLGQSLNELVRTNGHWQINGDIEADLLIGAGGHFCPVARHLGSQRVAGTPVVAAQEIEFEVPDEELDRVAATGDVPELYFCEDLKGYGWCFRKGNFLNIGLGRVNANRLSGHVAEFCQFLRDRGRVNCTIPAKFHGHAYRLYEGQGPNLVDDKALLIGDSAGLAYPQSGEGIRPAVESALIAAHVILEAQGHYTRENLEAYRDQLTRRLGKPRQGGPGDWLPAGWLQALASQLLATRWFSRKVVLDRWFLHTGEPALTA